MKWPTLFRRSKKKEARLSMRKEERDKRGQKHRCGRCGKAFDDETSYIQHSCPAVQGMKPTDPAFPLRR